MDHVDPRSDVAGIGGTQNLASACFDCNHEKGNQTLLLYLARHARRDIDIAEAHDQRRTATAPMLKQFKKMLGRT